MLPFRMSMSAGAARSARGEPLGDRDLVQHHLALDDGRDHVVQARLLGKLILAEFELVARLEHDHAATKVQGCRSRLPASADRRCRDAEAARMLTILSRQAGRGVETLLPSTTAVPTTMASTIRIVKMALPTMTSDGALAERRRLGMRSARARRAAAGGNSFLFHHFRSRPGHKTPFGIPLPTSRSLGPGPPNATRLPSGTETARTSDTQRIPGPSSVQQTRPPTARAAMANCPTRRERP